jgi:hypothetical protein
MARRARLDDIPCCSVVFSFVGRGHTLSIGCPRMSAMGHPACVRVQGNGYGADLLGHGESATATQAARSPYPPDTLARSIGHRKLEESGFRLDNRVIRKDALDET